ncbi:hypothetical protein L1887_09127 [Cichorium endivia]|nr:hypothetical protein L1887_09127 [Cichorium endivia]
MSLWCMTIWHVISYYNLVTSVNVALCGRLVFGLWSVIPGFSSQMDANSLFSLQPIPLFGSVNIFTKHQQ